MSGRNGAGRSGFARGALGQGGPASARFGQRASGRGEFGQGAFRQRASGREAWRGRRAARGLAAAALSLGALAAAGVAAPAEAAAGPRLGDCAAGDLCLWPDARFRGERHRYAPEKLTFGRCRRLPGHAAAESFANRTGRPVTVYESGECAETGAFHTHPSGTWTPESAYRVRAFKVWER